MSNCVTPTDKASEFLGHNLKPITRSGISYIEVTNDALSNLRTAILVAPDVARLYPIIPHSQGLDFLKKQLDSFS